MDKMAHEIATGQDERTSLLASVTPGGGKSWLPPIVGKQLIPGKADAICWVVPRINLASQAEQAFIDTRKSLGHSLSLRRADNQLNPRRGCDGYVTTYNAIHTQPDLHVHEFRRSRYILVLDEVHHVAVNSPWHHSLQRLWDEAAFRVLMTGAVHRDDRKCIAFVAYDGEQVKTPDIIYSRKAALQERAIVPLEFLYSDASARWIAANGEQKAYDSFDEADECGEYSSAMLQTSLTTEYAEQLLERGVRHWQTYRQAHPWAQLLIVVGSKDRRGSEPIRDVCTPLNRMLGYMPEIATYKESSASREAIKRFRERKSQVLVTVQMAYEGMDAPAVSHLIALTPIRSRPWIEQMLARAVRRYTARDDDKECAHVFCPDDPALNAAIQAIKDEQVEAAHGEWEDYDNGDRNEGDEVDEVGGIIPCASAMTETRVSAMDDEHRGLTQGQVRFLEQFPGALTMPTASLLRLIEATGGAMREKDCEHRPSRELTPREEEEALKREIGAYCRMVDRHYLDSDWGKANAEVKRLFNWTSRTVMPVAMLRRVWARIQQRWPKRWE
jgi:superfamily II DNA or RNA helicase